MTPRSFDDLLRAHADRIASQRAYAYLRDGEHEVASLTFGELERAVASHAGHLASSIGPGERAVLLFPQGLDFVVAFLACQRAGIIPVPVSLPNRQRGIAVLGGIASDCDARAILTTRTLLEQHANGLEADERLRVLRRLCTDEWPVDRAADGATFAVTGEHIALLQYTSGSTGTPRGVIVRHSQLIENQRQVELAFGHGPRSVLVSWLPMFHDMGLGTVLQALWLGVPCTLMAPSAFLQKPVRWLRAIAALRATTSGGPDFSYDLCVRRIDEQQKEGLNLESWRVAFNGAEPVRAATLDRFASAFASCGFHRDAFHPVYGLAEATLLVSAPDPAAPPRLEPFDAAALEQGSASRAGAADRTLVGCGRTWTTTRLEIVDPDRAERVADGHVGEIWVQGAAVASGYWNQMEESGGTFGAFLQPSNEGPFLRTGDLGFRDRGDVFITGRLKDLIIIRGRNHYPHDLEATAGASHAALDPLGAAAFSIDAGGEEQLVIVAEVRRTALTSVDTADVVRAIRAAMSDGHGLHTHAVELIRPGTLPRTSSGKVRRRACRQAWIERGLASIASWTFWVEPAEPAAAPESVAPSTRGVDDVLAWLREYAGRRLNSRVIDERRTMPPHVVLDLGNRGLLGMQVPVESGGLGFGHADAARVLQQLAAIDLTLCLFVGLNNYLGIRPIARHASARRRETLLPRLATGRELAAFALTEPGAGSNPRAIESRAEADGPGRWRLSGLKIWSGAAQWAGVINVFARHRGPDGRAGGISAFVVPQAASGLRQGPEALTMGMRGLIQNTVHLEGVPVTTDDLLGTLEAGMSVAHDAMMHARLAVAAASVGGMKRCTQLAVRYASRRDVATGRLLSHPVTLARLSRALAEIVALESLVTQVARAADRSDSVPVEAFAVCKAIGPELLWRAVDDLAQLLGGRGYIESNLVPQLLRDARVLRVFEGPTETMHAFLGARVCAETSGFERLFGEVLGAPSLLPRVLDVVARRRRGDDNIHRQHADLGALVAQAALLAAAQGEAARTATHAVDHAVSVCERAFERLARAEPVERALDAAQVRAMVDGFVADIGDIEQTLPAEEQPLDLLLRAAPPPATLTSVSAALDGGDRAAPRRPAETVVIVGGEIREWLLAWLAKRLRANAASLDPARSFADHGLDSLASVELVHDLSQWLGRPLDETLLWNFATPDALTAYLAGEAPPASPPTSGAPLTAARQPVLEEELARLERLLQDNP